MVVNYVIAALPETLISPLNITHFLIFLYNHKFFVGPALVIWDRLI